MKVTLDGKEIEVESGKTLKDLLPTEGNLVAIIRRIKEEEKVWDTFRLFVGKKAVILKIENQEIWKLIEKELEGLEVTWRTKRVLAFGSFACNLKCSNIYREYEPGEVVLSFAGGSSESAYLLFAITRYPISHCTFGEGIVARVLGGFEVLRTLEIGNKIEKVEPVIDFRSKAGIAIRARMEESLSEGDRIYSLIKVNFKKELSKASEYVMRVLERNNVVEEVTNTYVKFKGLKGIKVDEENHEKRIRGAVTVRKIGKNEGDVYIYLRDRMPHKDHCVVGFISEGLELLDVAKKGDKIKIITIPSKLDLIGLTQAEAGILLSKNGLKQVREGDVQDQDIVVSQIPGTTFEMLSKGEVVTVGVRSSKIVKLKIFDELAPKTSLYFRIATDLVSKKVGKLKVYFKTKDLVVFKPEVSFEEPLIPENTPRDLVKAGEIGVTNMSRKHSGLIGIRFNESKEFGPTAERFESTNIVGIVVENFEVIKEAKEGNEIYIMEVQE
ncbi:MAG: methanogenesis marker 3 protein [Archaeoglobaceae archaeon]|nr:methanogenesis marker 3 protein [Archaeoglobaceae archaeon]MDW8128209.1 methanogenesis marker 3 protein [Archaeoglobaceae archaeon]